MHISIQGAPQAPRFHHPSEGRVPRLAMVEVQMQPRRAPADAAIGDPDVEDRIGRIRQPVPQPGLRQQSARP